MAGGRKRERRDSGRGSAGAGPGARLRPAPPPPKRARPPTPVPAHYPDLEAKPEVAAGDDRDGHLVYKPGENITNRFKIMGDLGEGTFAKVLECWDRVTRTYVALKVVRNVPKYRSAAMLELEALNTVRRYDDSGHSRAVRLLAWFDWRGHICMVFERLGPSMYDFLRRNLYRPFALEYVRSFARQLLESVAALHRLTLCHTDLKPENILLRSTNYTKEPPPPGSKRGLRQPSSMDIRLIDFGSATFEADYHSSVVSTRHYRAPEVILGLGWSFPCDIWSIGCIIVELTTGEALFQTHDNLEHLAMMERVLGPLPPHMTRAATQHKGTGEQFMRGPLAPDGGFKLNWPNGARGPDSLAAVERMKQLMPCIQSRGDASLVKAAGRPGLRPPLPRLHDLLERMLAYDPSERITAEAALTHEFFQD